VEKWNAGMMEGWNTGKRSETENYCFLFGPIIPAFQYSIIPAGFAISASAVNLALKKEVFRNEKNQLFDFVPSVRFPYAGSIPD
jgi:hypothetical protein